VFRENKVTVFAVSYKPRYGYCVYRDISFMSDIFAYILNPKVAAMIWPYNPHIAVHFHNWWLP
jgi:hypothetical protein